MEKMFDYQTEGTCSSRIQFNIRDGRVHDVAFQDGCKGNLKALSILVEGMNAEELLGKLRGLTCGKRTTSCADQLARAIEEYKKTAS